MLTLPWDRARPARQDYRGGSVDIQLGVELTEQLKALAQSKGMTLYMVLLSAWGMLLSRLSSQETVVVGTPVANRPRAELEGLIGFFVNTLAIRLDVDTQTQLSDYLDEVKGRMLSAYDHQDVPFEQVVEELQPNRNLNHSPLFQAFFGFGNTPDEGEFGLTDVKMSGIDNRADSQLTQHYNQFEIALMVGEGEIDDRRVVQGQISFATALFDESTVQRWSEYLVRLLNGLVSPFGLERPVGLLPLISELEQESLLSDVNQTQVFYPKNKCIHELFEDQVANDPDAIALVSDSQEVTYGELNGQANQLAHYLVEQGVKGDTLVGLCLDRSSQMLVGLLAILKAGGAYVPLDPSDASDRIEHMLEDSGVDIVVSQLDVFVDLPITDQQVILVDLEDQYVDQPTTNPGVEELGVTPLNLAYVIYTSGSTGKPKGVEIYHRGVVNYLTHAVENYFAGTSGAVVSTRLNFDATVTSLLGPLVCGQRSILVESGDTESEFKAVRDYLKSSEESLVLKLTPAQLQLLQTGLSQEETLSELSHHVVIGGEQLKVAVLSPWVEAWLPNAVFVNEYGPTETVVGCSTYTVTTTEDLPEGGAVPIGKPIGNTQCYVMDSHGGLAPTGVVGELVVGGDGVSRGYLHQPALTAERFIENPFDTEADESLYRTGDLVRYASDGNLQFIGRSDDQIKLRGYRIEPGEIEAVLATHPAVDDAVVRLNTTSSSNDYLAAYMTNTSGRAIEKTELKAYLQQSLPEYMVPSVYVELDVLPLNASGKVDRGLLPEPQWGEISGLEYVAPEGETEEKLARIWEQLLGVERVGSTDDFFSLGGHSLLAAQLVARIEQELSRSVGLKAVFDYPELAALASELEDTADHEYIAIERVDRDQPLPLSWSQQRLWFIAQLDEQASLAYHMPVSVRLTGELNQEALDQTLNTLLERHEVLRTTFVQNEAGEPIQVIHPETSFALSRVDLSSVDREEQSQRLAELARVEAETAFDFEQGPLIRGQLIDIGVNNEKEPEYVLLATMHHIVSDGWSMGIFSREITALYAAYSSGKENPLAPLEIQYADYAHWQRSTLAEEGLGEQLSYWQGQLSDAPELLTLPWDRARPAQQRLSRWPVLIFSWE